MVVSHQGEWNLLFAIEVSTVHCNEHVLRLRSNHSCSSLEMPWKFKCIRETYVRRGLMHFAIHCTKIFALRWKVPVYLLMSFKTVVAKERSVSN
jgi:hypothetical protein